MTSIIDPARVSGAFPMTPTQQALWIGRGEAVELGNTGCYGYFEWERPSLDLDRYEAAWAHLLDHHPALRTVARADGQQQTLLDAPPVSITTLDLRGRADAADVLDRLRTQLGHQQLDPTSWPLFDARATWTDSGVRLHLGIDLQLMDASCLFQIIFPDLIRAYADPDAELRSPAVTFEDYARWCADELPSTATYRRDDAWWQDRLPELPAAPDLPSGTDVGGPVRFERRERTVPTTDRQRWQDFCSRAGFSASAGLTAVFAEVLRRWSSQPDFTLNYPVFDRQPMHPDIEHVAGDFTNALLVVARERGLTFLDRARDLADDLAQVRSHGSVNGIEILRRLGHQRGSSAASMPVVVTSLLEHPAPLAVSELGREVFSISQTPQVSLDFQIRELDGDLRLIWDSVDASFAPGSLDAMFESFNQVLDLLLATGPDDRDGPWHWDQLPTLPRSQVHQRAEVNDTETPVRDVLLQDLLFASASAHPESEALVQAGRRLTYADLAGYAERIGRRLRSGGAEVGELIAVVLDKGWEQYAAVYGILTSGAAYLPLDPGVPQARLEQLLALGQVTTVLTSTAVQKRFRWPEGITYHLVDQAFEPDGFDLAPLEPLQTPDDLAYVIFTSGSTGEPKGVMVEHRGVVNLVDDVQRRFGVGPTDRLLAISGLHFDASIYDVFGVLAAGGTVVLPPPFTRADPPSWTQLVHEESVTVWNSVPALMELLVTEAETGPQGLLESLRLAVLSGDWIPLDLPARLAVQAPQLRLVGSGGPTETICWSLFFPIDQVDPSWTSIPYGKPISNQRYYVVDRHRRQVPVGVVGEMAVASPVGLARGYLADARRTEATFVQLPETGERAYLTGDLGRHRADGNIEIIGRDDFQVKVAGYRIELGEIEAALRRQPTVHAAVVVAPTGDRGTRHLHAFVVGGGAGPSPDPEQVRAELARVLPHYMVPAVVTALTALPLTGNGKVDRLQLAALATDGPEAGAADHPAADAGEVSAVGLIVAACVADVLGLADVPLDANFFRLGGDSLSGTRVASRLRELLGVPVAIRTVFDHPDLGELAATIAADPETGADARTTAELLLSLQLDGVEPQP